MMEPGVENHLAARLVGNQLCSAVVVLVICVPLSPISERCTVELVEIIVKRNTATYSFRGIGSGITGYTCKLDSVTLPDCMLTLHLLPQQCFTCTLLLSSPNPGSSPLTGLTTGLHRLRVVPMGCQANQGTTFRFNV